MTASRAQFKAGGKRIFGRSDNIALATTAFASGKEMIGGHKWHYRNFERLDNYMKDANLRLASLQIKGNRKAWEEVQGRATNRLSYGSQWYGVPVPESVAELENHNKFHWMDVFGEVKKEVKSALKKLRKIKAKSVVEEKRRSYNSREMGIFSFDRAAMGLHYQKDKKGKNKLVTNFAEVYAYKETKKKEERSVTIYFHIGGNFDKSGGELMYMGVAASILKEELERIGVKLRIEMVGAVAHGNAVFVDFVRVKDFNKKMSLNDLLVLGSSPRWFRYNGFKSIVARFDHFRRAVPDGLGVMATAEPLIHQLNEGASDDYFILGKAYSLQEAVAEITHILDTIKTEK